MGRNDSMIRVACQPAPVGRHFLKSAQIEGQSIRISQ